MLYLGRLSSRRDRQSINLGLHGAVDDLDEAITLPVPATYRATPHQLVSIPDASLPHVLLRIDVHTGEALGRRESVGTVEAQDVSGSLVLVETSRRRGPRPQTSTPLI